MLWMDSQTEGPRWRLGFRRMRRLLIYRGSKNLEPNDVYAPNSIFPCPDRALDAATNAALV